MSLVDGYQRFIQTGGQATKTRAHAKQELQGLKSEGNKPKSPQTDDISWFPCVKQQLQTVYNEVFWKGLQNAD